MVRNFLLLVILVIYCIKLQMNKTCMYVCMSCGAGLQDCLKNLISCYDQTCLLNPKSHLHNYILGQYNNIIKRVMLSTSTAISI